ncbi:TorF family putative porin [Thalassolituus hydrocarboniclasticus]|uniref:Histidine kinase n=1 Tax=Thalassolituus hydrocarboniclasticus TaxID=2742796 RepID=A0ABY6A847_9GAMM|nr:TorF family putative porin [Thalassolituus hydrocarboniclasticus]UXD86065.1 histidine kinase [Thalassolituus hydrocarboniclasticus]
MKKLSQAIALAGVMTAGLAAVSTAQAEVEVSASASIANMYLWRGQDLSASSGVPAVSGDLTISTSGAYAGVWASSGDAVLGQEYDLFIGYGAEMGDFSYDVSLWTYVYPSAAETSYVAGDDPDTDDTVESAYAVTTADRGNTFDASDAIVSLGYKGASFTYYYPISSNPNDYSYMTLGYEMDALSATLGMADSDDDASKYTHLDLSYAYNDNIAFTLSKVVSQEADLDKGEAGVDEDLKVVVSYSLPISM